MTNLPPDATEGQRAAFDTLLNFCSRGVTSDPRILCGYAGTGKTWLTGHLVRAAHSMGKHVAVCAPTHKAVAVLAGKLQCNAWTGTLHSLLGLKLSETHDGEMSLAIDRKPNTLYFEDYDVVVIDESSMIGPMLISYIDRFRRIRNPRVIYVGDPGQLLPVESKSDLYAPLLSPDEHKKPSVFSRNWERCDLTEIVRQKSTGRPHPIVQFAQEIRYHIEDKDRGVFGPKEIRAYLETHADDFKDVVRTASADQMANGAIKLRRRHKDKDIRVVCWRNRVVDDRNRSIHSGLSDVYGAVVVAEAPYWPGETIVAREALYGFHVYREMHLCKENAVWEAALSPSDRPREKLVTIVQNNTEMTVRLCEPIQHPYLNIPAWRIQAKLPNGGVTEFYVADYTQAHQKMARDTWSEYRSLGRRVNEEFRKAWTVSRACAPVMHGYAMTAHKSQGSTFDYVLVDVSDLYGMVKKSGAEDYHRALYVAVTRASERAWLCL
ncbi:MAG: ATP-dependent DNA helicase [Sulfobacillus sp.]